MSREVIQLFTNAKDRGECICGYKPTPGAGTMGHHKKDCELWNESVKKHLPILVSYVRTSEYPSRAKGRLGMKHVIERAMGEPLFGRRKRRKPLPDRPATKEHTASPGTQPLVEKEVTLVELEKAVELLLDAAIQLAKTIQLVAPGIKSLRMLDEAYNKYTILKTQFGDVIKLRDREIANISERARVVYGEDSLVSRR